MNTKKLMMFGLVAAGAYLLWKRNASALMPGAVAVSASAPSTAVSATNAPTTANMVALATAPSTVAGLGGGYGSRLSGTRVRYPSPSPWMRFN